MTNPKFTNVLNEDDLQRKTTSNIKSDIAQQPLVGSFPNFKLKLTYQLRGKLKGNLECGSAQPSLFNYLTKS